VTDLDAALRDLAAHMAFPEPPDVAAAVRLRLTSGASASRRAPASAASWWRRPGARRLVALAAVVLLVIVAVAAAVPRARHAVADRLGLRGVEVRVVPTTAGSPSTAVPGTGGAGTGGAATTVPGTAVPVTGLPSGADLGRPTTLAAAAAADPGLLVPPEAPTGVWTDDRTGEVNLTFGDGLLLGQFPNAEPIFEKLIAVDEDVVAVEVAGGRGLWLPGDTHVVIRLAGGAEEARPRLAGPTLVWEHGDRTLRLEGATSLDAALAVATSLRAHG
jgi:hypothetical protein